MAPRARRLSGRGHRVQESPSDGFEELSISGTGPGWRRAGRRASTQLLELGLVEEQPDSQAWASRGSGEGRCLLNFSARSPKVTISQHASSWSWKNSWQPLPIPLVAKPATRADARPRAVVQAPRAALVRVGVPRGMRGCWFFFRY